MKYTFQIFAIVAVLELLASNALANEELMSGSWYRENPEVVELAPWLSQFERRLMNVPGNDQERVSGNRTFSKRMICQIWVDNDGKLKKIDLVQSSGSSVIDDWLTSLIRKTSPFEPPPNQLPVQQGIFLTVDVDGVRNFFVQSTGIPEPSSYLGERPR